MARPLPRISVSSDDETLVELNADQLEVAKKEVGELWMVLKMLHEGIEKGTLTAGLRNTYCSCLESFATRLNKAIGHDSDLEKQHMENAKFVREANIEIARLERLVGSSRGLEGVADMLTLMRDNFGTFWRDECPCGCLVYDTPGYGAGGGRGDGGGFYPSRGELRYTAELAPGFNEFERSFSDTPVSDKENQKNWLDEISQHLDLYRNGSSSRDAEMLDTPRNRAYVTKLLQDRFPSLVVNAWGIQSVYGEDRDTGLMQIRHLKITIHNVEEMLPTEEETQKREAKEEAWRKQK